ncbi:MAG: hypothetical protein KBG24_13005 [Bacteroidia bacterium]|jgi:hypothetical protein|nr:hypothetical protein [Bacteroidia bacterium]MBP9181407.1 hypothetical protein [Bacteroidia bacterium]
MSFLFKKKQVLQQNYMTHGIHHLKANYLVYARLIKICYQIKHDNLTGLSDKYETIDD